MLTTSFRPQMGSIARMNEVPVNAVQGFKTLIGKKPKQRGGLVEVNQAELGTAWAAIRESAGKRKKIRSIAVKLAFTRTQSTGDGWPMAFSNLP